MRLAYFGTPAMAVPSLTALVAAGHEVAIVVTRVDKCRGRGGELSPSPVKQAALALGLPVSHDVDDVLGKGIELGVVVAFGQLIKPHVLAEVPMVNSHFSLLPRWRGAAPVERAVLAGDAETGVCLMQLEEGLDTGGVYDTVRVPIGAAMTADELRRELVAAGCEQLVRCLAGPLPTPTPQVGEPLYAAKITPDDLRIRWAQGAQQIDRVIRLGGAWTTFREKRVKVLSATLDSSARVAPCPVAGLTLQSVQPEGKGPMPFADFARGARPAAAEWFV